MSKTSTCSAAGETSGAQEMTASRASSSGRITSSCSPVSRGGAREEVVAVARAPAGLGGDEPHVPDAVALELLGADLERREGAADGAAGKMAGALEPGAEPHRLGEGVHDAKAPASGVAISIRQLFVPRSRAAYSSEGRRHGLRPAPPRRQRYTILRRLGQVVRHWNHHVPRDDRRGFA